jgi:hypothetical protein
MIHCLGGGTGKIREMAKAIGDPNPIYLDKEAAIRDGYRDTPVHAHVSHRAHDVELSCPCSSTDLKINF